MKRVYCDTCHEEILPLPMVCCDEVAPGVDACVSVTTTNVDLCRKCIVAWLRRLWSVR